jgi:hypothetical protein
MAGNSGGNRQDNRQRGNAAQLLEKYKSMARDAQLAGDRVQTEYYLQFADHYFRVLGDSRPRLDEQKRQRGDDDGDDDGDDRMEAEADAEGESEGQSYGDSDEQPQRRRARPNNDRFEPRRDRPNGRARDEVRDDVRDDDNRRDDDGDERIDFAVLPPAIGADDDREQLRPTDDDAEDAPAPRRRARRPRVTGNDGDDASAS